MTTPPAADPAPAPDMPDDREIVDMPQGFPLPEIFLMPDDPNEDTGLRIDIAYVYKKAGDKSWPLIDQRPIGDLRTLGDMTEAYGPGQYRLIGRNAESPSRNVKLAHQTLGTPETAQEDERRAIVHHHAPPAPPAPQLDLTKLVTTLELLARPFLTLFEQNRARAAEERQREREEYDRRMREERERDRQHHETMMQVVTGLQNGRIEELRRLATAPANARGAVDTADSYKQGQADLVAILEAAKESGITSGGGNEDKFLELASSFIQGAGAARKPLPPAPASGANGNGAAE